MVWNVQKHCKFWKLYCYCSSHKSGKVIIDLSKVLLFNFWSSKAPLNMRQLFSTFEMPLGTWLWSLERFMWGKYVGTAGTAIRHIVIDIETSSEFGQVRRLCPGPIAWRLPIRLKTVATILWLLWLWIHSSANCESLLHGKASHAMGTASHRESFHAWLHLVQGLDYPLLFSKIKAQPERWRMGVWSYVGLAVATMKTPAGRKKI